MSLRLAWFSPMPPVRTGIAAYSEDLVAWLRAEHEIDVFVDAGAPAARVDGPARFRSAHDFVWLHRRRPYDLAVYQLGNSSHHDYIWPYLFRFPGLAVLHDAHLHHARAALLLRERRADDYRAEFAANGPGTDRGAAELAVAGFDSFLHYESAFTRLVCVGSRLAAVHSRIVRDELAASTPGVRVEHVRLGHGVAVGAAAAAVRGARARARYGIPGDSVLFGCFGGLTPDKRIPQVLDAFAAVLPYAPSARLMLAGPEAGHYDVRADVTRRGLESRVVCTGYLETEDELTDGIAACDVTLNLRWPTAREISGPWLRCLAAGRASITVDLRHLADVPSLDPRTWAASSASGAAPVTVAIDIMDEDHSLRLAMRRLAADAALREALGAAARAAWSREHSPAVMLEDYRRLLQAAAAAPAPAAALPDHLTADHGALGARILARFATPLPWSKI